MDNASPYSSKCDTSASTSLTNFVNPFYTLSIYEKAQSRESERNLIKFSLCIDSSESSFVFVDFVRSTYS